MILDFNQGPYLAAGVFALIYPLSVIQSLKAQGKRNMSPGKSWMWSEALDLLHSAERLQRQFFRPGARNCWEPPVDIYQSDGDLWIFLALPGVTAEHTQVSVEGAVLVVHGDRPLPQVAQGASIHRLEIPYGPFERRIGLPEGHYQILQKAFDNGCLVIGLRRLEGSMR